MPAGRGFGLVVPDKARLDHARFDQSDDDWSYNMYFTMLRPIFCAPHRYRIYLDVKDARGGPKTRIRSAKTIGAEAESMSRLVADEGSPDACEH